MSDFRKLSFLHQNDYFVFNKELFKVDWCLKDNNAINMKTNKPCYINENEQVKWLRWLKNIHIF